MDNRDFINEYFADSDSDEEFLGFNEDILLDTLCIYFHDNRMV